MKYRFPSLASNTYLLAALRQACRNTEDGRLSLLRSIAISCCCAVSITKGRGMLIHLGRRTCGRRSGLSTPLVLGPKIAAALQLRQYVVGRWPKPGYDFGKHPSTESSSQNPKARTSPRPGAKFEQNAPPLPRRGLRRYGITPWRLIVISVLAYTGYKLYYWQTDPRRSIVLNGKYFTPFLLESKVPVSPTNSIFKLMSVPPGQNTSNITTAWKLGVWSVQIMQPELQTARSYTPLPPDDHSSGEQIRLVVRKEPEGLVSSYLHRLAPGFMVHIRGPHPEYVIPNDVEEVLFLAGGTGVATALQTAYCLYKARDPHPADMPKMHILWANRRREDSFARLQVDAEEKKRSSIMAKVRASLSVESAQQETSKKLRESVEEEFQKELSEQSLLIKEVAALKDIHGGRVTVDYFVDEENSFIDEKVIRKYLSTEDATIEQQNSTRKKLLIISGPGGFVSRLAGPKLRQGGREIQGPITGILENIDHGGWEIWKL